MTDYSFVLDADGKPLSPTKEVKAWYMIRKRKASLVSKYPMTIQLKQVIPTEEICKDEIRLGLDDGGLHTGIAIVQKCQTKNKVLFKGTIEQRNDVKHLMEVRRGYRRYHRYHKRYRKQRFNNRKASKRSLLMLAITYHAIYNTIVMSPYKYFGFVLPFMTYLPILLFYSKRKS